MAYKFKEYDQKQMFLLPLSIRDTGLRSGVTSSLRNSGRRREG